MDEKNTDALITLMKREIRMQCEFSIKSVEHMNQYLQNLSQNDQTNFWFALQSFLTATANISKLLFGTGKNNDNIRSILKSDLNVTDNSSLRNRTLRNHYEHYDERLITWASKSENGIIIDTNITSSSEISVAGAANTDYMRNFDITNNIATFQNQSFEIQPLVNEVLRLHSLL